MKISAVRIAAVVVLYHPYLGVIENIRSWSDQVAWIYIVDNSENQGTVATGTGDLVNWFDIFDNVTFLPQGDNVGIARALNIAAELAVKDGYDCLLTMDQDSRAHEDLVARLVDCRQSADGRPGIIAPFHLTRAVRGGLPSEEVSEVMTPMTSGCLLDLEAWREVGPFRDDFFIDFVDNEFCLRLLRNGYRVLRANRALLEHNVGDITRFGPLIATNHSPLRRYYKTRNRLKVFREYLLYFPGHCLFDLVRLMKEIVAIMLFERNKFTKLLMMCRGARDFMRGHFGRFDG